MNEELRARKAALMKEVKERVFYSVDSIRNNPKYIAEEEPEKFFNDVRKISDLVIKFGFMTESERNTISELVKENTWESMNKVLELIYKNFKLE